jgi:hypothetical protein
MSAGEPEANAGVARQPQEQGVGGFDGFAVSDDEDALAVVAGE